MKNLINDSVIWFELQEEINKTDKDKLEEIVWWFGRCTAYATMDNPLVYNFESEINESLVKTYPITSAKKHICKYFNLPEKFFIIKQDEYITYAYILIPYKNASLKDIIKSMEWFGYVCCEKNPKPFNDEWYHLKFESKFGENANSLLNGETHLIHLTPAKNMNKILKNGFVPKSTNNRFGYNDRVYFMFGSVNPINTFNLCMSLKKWQYPNEENVEYCAFRISVGKIPSNVVFHLDPNMEGAVYTMDNISPTVIEDYKTFNI